LRRQIAVEQEQINRLLEIHRPLLRQCQNVAPNGIELSALAALLHSFYTGVENIFKRVAFDLDRHLPSGQTWHRDLLEQMARGGEHRPAVISQALRGTLREYLQFRHVFRSAYSFDLDWEKMSGLVLNCEDVWRRLEAEMTTFLQGGDDSGPSQKSK
jgi:hypothetical protein